MSSGFGRTQSRRQFLQMLSRAGVTLPFMLQVPYLLAADAATPVVFTDVTTEAGLAHAKNISGSPTDKQFLLEEMGGGVALFDYDNDGWLDIFLVNGTSLDPSSAPRAHRPAPEGAAEGGAGSIAARVRRSWLPALPTS